LPGDYHFEKRSPKCSGCGREFAVGEEYHSALVVEELEVPLDPEALEEQLAAEEADPDARQGTPGAAAPPESPPEGKEVENGAEEKSAPIAAAPPSSEGGLPFRRMDLCPDCWDPEGPAEYFSFWKAVVPDEEEQEKPLAKRIDAETIYDMFRRLEGHADPEQQKFRFILALMLMRKKRLKFTGVVDSPHGEHLVLDDREEGVTHKVLDPGLAEEEVDSLRGQIDRLLGGTGEPEPEPEAEAEPEPEAEPEAEAGPAPVAGEEARPAGG